ncbi:MAG: MATE family efflux transporter [Solitalea-like symbiont of Tyrophagus putrescentiae]
MLSALFFKYKYHYSVSLKLAIPIIISQLGHILVGMADSIIIGHTNSAALAACAISNSIFGIFMVTGIGISYGLTPLISQEYGRKNFKLCGNLLSDSLWINMITGVMLYVLLELSMRFAYHLNQPEEVIGQAIIYTKYLALSIIPLMIYLTFKQFTEGLGLTKQSMNITIAGNVVNIVLGVVLVFGLFGVKPMGIAGIGISTLVDRILMAIAMALYAFLGKKTQPFIANFKLKSFSWANTKNILKIGMPMSLLYIFEFGAFSISMIMSGWINTTSQAAMQIAINAANPSYMIASGLGSAATVKAGNYYGAGNMKHLRLSGLSSYHLVIFFLCVYTIVFIIIRNYIPLIYVNSSDTDVIALASQLLLVSGAFLIFDGIQVVGTGILRGMGDVLIPTFYNFIAYFVCGVPIGYLLCFTFNLGAVGILLGLLIGLILSSLFLYLRFNYKTKKLLYNHFHTKKIYT